MVRRYLYGTEFKVVTDHQRLVPLYNNPSRPALVGVERQRSKLRHFTFDLHYEPGYISPCDNASRKPPPKTNFSKEEKEEQGMDGGGGSDPGRGQAGTAGGPPATVAHGGGDQGEEEQGHQELGIWAGVQ